MNHPSSPPAPGRPTSARIRAYQDLEALVTGVRARRRRTSFGGCGGSMGRRPSLRRRRCGVSASRAPSFYSPNSRCKFERDGTPKTPCSPGTEAALARRGPSLAFERRDRRRLRDRQMILRLDAPLVVERVPRRHGADLHRTAPSRRDGPPCPRHPSSSSTSLPAYSSPTATTLLTSPPSCAPSPRPRDDSPGIQGVPRARARRSAQRHRATLRVRSPSHDAESLRGDSGHAPT